MSMEEAKKNRKAPPDTPSNLGSNASKDIAAALTALLADVFALHVTTKNCHWHISGQYFRDYHLLLDEQAAQILAMTDDIAEGARKIGGTTIRPLGHFARLKHIEDNDPDLVPPEERMTEHKAQNITQDRKSVVKRKRGGVP